MPAEPSISTAILVGLAVSLGSGSVLYSIRRTAKTMERIETKLDKHIEIEQACRVDVAGRLATVETTQGDHDRRVSRIETRLNGHYEGEERRRAGHG